MAGRRRVARPSFTQVEEEGAASVVVINQKLAELLFDQLDPIGRRVHIQGMPYTVIGVFNPPPQLFGGQPSPEAVIPHGALAKYIDYWRGWMDLLVGPTDGATTAQAMEAVTEVLRMRRGLRPGQENNFAVVSQEKFLESLNSTTLMIRIVMFALSGDRPDGRRHRRHGDHDDLGHRAHARDRRAQGARAPRGARSCGSSWSRPPR